MQRNHTPTITPADVVRILRENPRRWIVPTVLFGVLAAIPTPVMGTPVGLALLAWTGLGKLFGKTAHK